MTIRNTTGTTSTADEPDFFSAPIYECAGQTIASGPTGTSSWLVPYDDSSAANMPVVEPFSSATALTADQSYRRENQNQQLITIPSSSVLIDTSAPTQTTTTTTTPDARHQSTIHPVQVVPVDHYYPFEPSSASIIDINNSKYIRQYGMLINRKNAHLPEPVLQFKQARKRRTVVAAWTGGAVGLVVAGPLGAALGAGAAYASAKTVGKTRERRLEQRYASRGDPLPPLEARRVEQVIV